MAIGSGLAASIGIAAESTYGTYVAPTRFLEMTKHQLRKDKNTAMSKAPAAGRTVPLASRRVVTTRAASGSVELEVPNKGFGLLLNALIGGTVTPVQQATTTAYLQTHTLSATQDVWNKMLTVQCGVPDAAGTVRPYTFLGAKPVSMEFSCGIDELLMCTAEFDCRDVVETETLVAPSYLTGTRPFHFGQATVKIGATVGGATSVAGVRKAAVKISRKMDVGRFHFGQAGLKAQPILNDTTEISGTLEAEFIDKTVFADRFAADTQFSLILEFVGPVIESTYFETFRITLPACFLDDEGPAVDGPDIVKSSLKYSVLNDGTNAPATIEIISTDTTI